MYFSLYNTNVYYNSLGKIYCQSADIILWFYFIFFYIYFGRKQVAAVDFIMP